MQAEINQADHHHEKDDEYPHRNQQRIGLARRRYEKRLMGNGSWIYCLRRRHAGNLLPCRIFVPARSSMPPAQSHGRHGGSWEQTVFEEYGHSMGKA
jgi:hypothetical protein